jgi:hypothetical protein
MNKQEYLDLLVRTSLEGKFPSVHPDKGEQVCAYRGKDGRACAIGLVIPDDQYIPEFEFKSYKFLIEAFPSIVSYLPAGFTEYDFIEIQKCHDETYDMFKGENLIQWSHRTFLRKLLARDCFKRMSPTSPLDKLIPGCDLKRHDRLATMGGTRTIIGFEPHPGINSHTARVAQSETEDGGPYEITIFDNDYYRPSDDGDGWMLHN